MKLRDWSKPLLVAGDPTDVITARIGGRKTADRTDFADDSLKRGVRGGFEQLAFMRGVERPLCCGCGGIDIREIRAVRGSFGMAE